MKAKKSIVFFAAIFFSFTSVHAQSGNALASERAILFADSLLKSFHHNNFDQYAELSYPGVISYYGGKKNFREYVQRSRSFINGEHAENIKLIQLISHISEWQCVVEKTYETMIDGKNASIISYMVGQSKDEGRNWKFIDVAFNPVDNIAYIMPDIFNNLTIPQRQVVYEKNNFAGKM